MLMLGNTITGERGHGLGLVNRLADADGLRTATELAAQLAAGQRTSALRHKGVAGARRNRCRRHRVRAHVAADLFDTPDGREGFAAFLEKRSPKFVGR